MNSIDTPQSPQVAEAAPEFDGLRMLSNHATSAGSIDGHLGDVLKLTELLGDPHALTAPVPSAHWIVIGTDDESMRPHMGRFRSYGGAR